MKLQREAEPSPTTTRHKRRIVILAILVAAILACVGFSSSLAFDYAEILDTYWDVHDQVLFPTERGRHYIDLYWAHSRELVQILMENPEVRGEGLALTLEFAPPPRALVEGQGSSVVITEDMVRRVDDYLLALHELSGPDLRATTESERAEAAFESLIGLTFEEARMRLVGPPVYPLPRPLPTRFP